MAKSTPQHDSTTPTRPPTRRQLLQVSLEADGKLSVDVLGTWPHDPDNAIPARLAAAVAVAIMQALAGDDAVREFRAFNQPVNTRPQ